MKKIFTFIAATFMAVCASAQTTLFYYTVSEGDGISSATAEVGTVVLPADNKVELNSTLNIYAFKFDGTKCIQATLADGATFSAGNVISITMIATSNPSGSDFGLAIYDAAADGILVKKLYCTQKNTAETFSYTIQEGDALVGKSDFYIFRATEGKSTYFVGAKVMSEAATSDATPATVLDLTTVGAVDKDNLNADTNNWEPAKGDGETGWKNKAVLTERNVYTALKANGMELEMTKGLQFTRDNSTGLQAGAIFIKEGTSLNIASSNVMIAVNVAKDDVVKVKFFSNGDTERGFNITNADKSSIMSTSRTDIKEETLTVTADGQLILKTTASVNLVALTINADLPSSGETGIGTVQAGTVDNGAVYNLAGQQVDISYKGIVIHNGKKFVQK